MLDIPGRGPSSKAPDPFSTGASRSPGLTTATQVLAGVGLLGALKIGLLTSLLAGLLVHELVHTLAPRPSTLVTRRAGKIVVVSLLGEHEVLWGCQSKAPFRRAALTR